MIKLTSLDTLEYVTKHLNQGRPNGTDFYNLIKDGVAEIKIINKGNYCIFTYQFNIDAKRYQDVKETFDTVELTSHRWKGVNQKYITVLISQKIEHKYLLEQSLIHQRTMKGYESANNDGSKQS